ncbi:MAG: acyltransferase [Bradymonadales bacterium]|nr:acyltransferase [Bradymonadales bacterium]
MTTSGTEHGTRGYHLPALDGVRGAAILAVVAMHSIALSGVEAGDGQLERLVQQVGMKGWAGVDMFLVLSGFLVTWILLKNRGQPGYFRSFYLRRALRIFPLYYLFLAVVLVILPSLVTVGPIYQEALDEPWWHWCYLTNIQILLQGRFASPVIDHVWMLAVELHFYAIWPFVVLFVPARRLRKVLYVVIVGATALRLVLLEMGVSTAGVRVFTFCRFDAFALGGLAATFLLQDELRRFWRVLVLLAAITGLLGALSLDREFFHYVAVQGFIPLVFVWIITQLVREDGLRVLKSLFEFAPLRTLGKYSYGIYLFHEPLLTCLAPAIASAVDRQGRMPVVVWLVVFVLFTGLTTLLAWITYHGFEKHFLKLKDRLAPVAKWTFTPTATSE